MHALQFLAFESISLVPVIPHEGVAASYTEIPELYGDTRVIRIMRWLVATPRYQGWIPHEVSLVATSSYTYNGVAHQSPFDNQLPLSDGLKSEELERVHHQQRDSC